ncbi:MAG: UDP-N-acetylmuramate dehydrogenase [Venatoribacter sp.]
MLLSQFDLTALNTLALLAKAEYFAKFSSLVQLQHLLAQAKAQGLAVTILGEGSNVLLSPHINGLVLTSAMHGVEVLEQNSDFCLVQVEAGKNWHEWVLQSTQYGHGLENLALIPGTVGAAPVQNIGAYGVEVERFIEQVQGVQISTGEVRNLSAKECRFSYRDSIFKQELNNDFIITAVVFRLSSQFAPVLSYGALASQDITNSSELIQAVIDIRNSKLPNPKRIPNAGSFFKNPIVSQAQAQAIQAQYPSAPCYVQADNRVKLAAGWLIEQAGWKGKSLGNVSMHSQQALVLTSNGKASLNDVLALKQAVQQAVLQQFGVELEAEPRLIG